jgi:hypothetical protein
MPWGFAIGAIGTIYAADSASDTAADNRQAIEDQAASEAGMHESTLNYYRERDAQNAALQAQANAIAGRVADSQIATMDQQRRISGEYHDRNKGVFWPLEDGLVTDAQEYDTPERREQKAGDAMADIGLQYGQARQAQDRNMQRMGVNPNSAKFGLANNQMSLGLASAQAAAGKSARDQVETQGWARRMDAASLGRNLPSAQATAASTAVSAGNGALGAAYAPVNAANAATGIMGNAMANYNTGMSNAGRLGLSAYNVSTPNYASAFSGLGQAAGQYFGGGTNHGSNLSYANGVSSAGGDGLGAFIDASNF